MRYSKEASDNTIDVYKTKKNNVRFTMFKTGIPRGSWVLRFGTVKLRYFSFRDIRYRFKLTF